MRNQKETDPFSLGEIFSPAYFPTSKWILKDTLLIPWKLKAVNAQNGSYLPSQKWFYGSVGGLSSSRKRFNPDWSAHPQAIHRLHINLHTAREQSGHYNEHKQVGHGRTLPGNQIWAFFRSNSMRCLFYLTTD